MFLIWLVRLQQQFQNYNFNIADMVNRSRGEYAYTMIDIDNKVNGDIIPSLEAKINSIAGIVTARII